MGTLILCGGVGLLENMDIVADGGTLFELESLHHWAVDSDTDVEAESLINLACFASGFPDGRVCGGMVRFGLFGLGSCVGVVMRSDGGDSGAGGRVSGSSEDLPVY